MSRFRRGIAEFLAGSPSVSLLHRPCAMNASTKATIVALVIGLSSCSSTLPIADGGGSDQSQDVGDCHCSVDQDGFLVMSWDCYCAKWGCDDGLACLFGDERTDYPACGLTVLSRQSFGVTSSVYDSSGALVGQTIQSDTTPYACPSNSALTAARVRAGQAPASGCVGIACGACTTVAFPCASAADGGPGQ
jgi:hypothetical protein